MSTFSDNFGIWNELGTINPTLDNWTKSPEMAVGGLEVIRLNFIYDFGQNTFSYGLIRAIYQVEGLSLTTQALKIYPQPEALLLNFLIPKDFKDRDIYFRNFEVKKINYFKRRYDSTLPWQVKLDELWG